MAINTSYVNHQLFSYGNQDQSGSKQTSATQEKSVGGHLKKLAQASDELSAGASQFANRRTFDKKGSSLSESFERVLEEDVLPKAQSLLKMASIKDANLQALLRQARSLFPDESDLIMVLRELLRRKLGETVKKKLNALLEQAEAEANPRDVKAGINCALKARLFGRKSLELKPSMLRGSYRLFLQREEGEAVEDYKDWIACFGYGFRHLVADFIESSLLTDIDSQDPSCSKVEFGYLLGKLGQLKRLRSADFLFIKKLLSNKAIGNLQKGEPDLLVLLFSLLKQPDGIAEHLNVVLGNDFLLTKHVQRSLILHSVYLACKSLPHELFENVGHAHLLLAKLEDLASIALQHERLEIRRY
jgi:type III secretion protein W